MNKLCGSISVQTWNMILSADHEEIEVLSSENVEIEVADISGDRCNPSRDNLLSSDREEIKRKRIARAVCIVATLFVIFSCILVGISFSMTDDINDMVRNSNELLRKHSKSTPLPLPNVRNAERNDTIT